MINYSVFPLSSGDSCAIDKLLQLMLILMTKLTLFQQDLTLKLVELSSYETLGSEPWEFKS